VLGVWSSRDSALTESQMCNSERWVQANWRYERIEGASHWMMLDRPQELNALLLDWLAAEFSASV
jgi:pimeloyl-ACP methyl ester carboxylesterase